MSPNFDPYHEWLGLKLDKRPNYYQLLGLDSTETNRERISAAADRALARVRARKPGSFAREWSALLDEIKSAKEILSSPPSRQKYDEELRKAENSGSRAPVIVAKPRQVEADPNLLPPGMEPVKPGPTLNPSKPPPIPSTSSAAVTASIPHEDRSAMDPAMAPYVPSPMPATNQFRSAIESADSMQDPMQPVSIPGGPTRLEIAKQPTTSADRAAEVPWSPVTASLRIKSKSVAAASRRRSQKANWGIVGVITSLALIGVLVGILRFGLAEKLSLSSWNSSASNSVGPDAKPNSSPPVPHVADWKAVSRPTNSSPPEKLADVNSLGNQNTKGDMETAVAEPSKEDESLAMEEPSSAESNDTAEPEPNTASATDKPTTDPGELKKPSSLPATENPESISPVPATAKPEMSPADIKAIVTALRSAREAIGEQKFAVAERLLTKSESLAKLPKYREQVERLTQLASYSQQFRQGLIAATNKLEAGQSIKVGKSTYVGFVEARVDSVILRVAGQNKTYPLETIPPGLAVAIADTQLPLDDPRAMLARASFLALHPNANEDTLAKARELFESAAVTLPEAADLIKVLDDTYE